MTSWQIVRLDRGHVHPAVARARRSGQPPLRQPVVAGLHRIRRRQPAAKRAHPLVPDGNILRKLGAQAGC